jgi:hypothetical protein
MSRGDMDPTESNSIGQSRVKIINRNYWLSLKKKRLRFRNCKLLEQLNFYCFQNINISTKA